MGRGPRFLLASALAVLSAGSLGAQGRGPSGSPNPTGFRADTTPPQIVCPPSIVTDCAGPEGAVVNYFVIIGIDEEDPSDPLVVCTPPSGSVFPLGTTLVTCTATDEAGNVAECSFTVSVLTTIVIECPGNIVVEGTHPDGADATFAPGASSSCGAHPVTASVPSSGSRFPLGVTPVTCKATDESGALAQCVFSVEVRDTIAPEIHAPPLDVSVEPLQFGALVFFTPEVVDLCDRTPTLVCEPPSGSFFPLGLSDVTCTATDDSGNQSVQHFPLQVTTRLRSDPISPGDMRRSEDDLRGTEASPVGPPAGWYSGDTHEHVQYCNGSVHWLTEILARMNGEDLNVASVLIWDQGLLGYPNYICSLTGQPDPLSSPRRLLQFGVETSGLDCARWGHLIGLNVGPEEARIAFGSVQLGACADMPGLGFGGDGTGTLNAPIAERFLESPGAVCGYGHTYWQIGLYHPRGYDWKHELLDTSFTTDALYLDPGQPLAVPNVSRLMGVVDAPASVRAFLPLLGAMDAVLGDVQFFETIAVPDSSEFMPTSPPSNWYSMFYKLLSAGVRVAISGGTDRACFSNPQYPRTYVLVDEALSYDSWVEGLAAGRTSVAVGAGIFLHLRCEGSEVGGEIQLTSAHPFGSASVELLSAGPIDDCIELIVDGEVWDSQPVHLEQGGSFALSFDDVPFVHSSWISARLCSKRAHTGAIYVILDGRPIVDPIYAEYWMLWCDIVTKTTRDHPEIAFFDGQRDEALERIAQARSAFKTLRDAAGLELNLGVARYGRSQPACRGPIAIGAGASARAGEKLLLTCVNAPPLARGTLVLSRRAFEDVEGGAGSRSSSPASREPAVIATFPARSTRSGYAEVWLPAVPAGEAELHARFVWEHGPGCPGAGCRPRATLRASSDALRLTVRGSRAP